jgi:nucleotide-binding universal stress UspA family protein
MMPNILVGYDGSAAAVNALSFAADLARAFDSSLHVLAVVRRSSVGRRAE